MAALVEAQQRNDAQIRELGEKQERTHQQIQALVRVTSGMFDLLRQNMERTDSFDRRMDQLGQRMDQLSQRMDQLAAAEQRTEERLHRLAESVQRFIDAQSRRDGGEHPA